MPGVGQVWSCARIPPGSAETPVQAVFFVVFEGRRMREYRLDQLKCLFRRYFSSFSRSGACENTAWISCNACSGGIFVVFEGRRAREYRLDQLKRLFRRYFCRFRGAACARIPPGSAETPVQAVFLSFSKGGVRENNLRGFLTYAY